MSTDSLEEAVESAIQGGCSVIQLREKDVSSNDFYEIALRVKEITNRYGVPLIINDRVDIALAVDADGVHVGQSDLNAAVVRKLLGTDKILGVSTANVAEAKKAMDDGADYIGVGAMNATSTKTNTRAVTVDTLVEIRNEVSIPIVAIGGINKETIKNLYGTGIDGVAVVSAIIAQKNIKEAAKEMVELAENL